MIRRPCYIAAPYGSPDPLIRWWNVRRACLLGLLAQRRGFAPLVVHPMIEAGALGCDDDDDERAQGQESSLRLLRLAVGVGGVHGGLVYALRCDDGSLSEGVGDEITVAHTHGAIILCETWSAWRPRLAAYGLGPLADALTGRPGGAT